MIETYHSMVVTDESMPEAYAKHLIEGMENKVALTLWQWIKDNGGDDFVTVKVYRTTDQLEPDYHGQQHRTKNIVTVELGKSIYREPVVYYPKYEDMTWQSLSGSAVKEIKRRIVSRVKRWFGR